MEVVERMLKLIKCGSVGWSEGINNDLEIRRGDHKRCFTPNMDMEKCMSAGYDPTAVLREHGFDELLRHTTAAKGTGIMQLEGCASQIEHTDYKARSPAFDGPSVPFGCLLALTPRSTYVRPRSHILTLQQARVIVNQEPGDILIMRGDVRHGGDSSIGETFGHHTYFDRPGVRGGKASANSVHI